MPTHPRFETIENKVLRARSPREVNEILCLGLGPRPSWTDVVDAAHQRVVSARDRAHRERTLRQGDCARIANDAAAESLAVQSLVGLGLRRSYVAVHATRIASRDDGRYVAKQTGAHRTTWWHSGPYG